MARCGLCGRYANRKRFAEEHRCPWDRTPLGLYQRRDKKDFKNDQYEACEKAIEDKATKESDR